MGDLVAPDLAQALERRRAAGRALARLELDPAAQVVGLVEWDRGSPAPA